MEVTLGLDQLIAGVILIVILCLTISSLIRASQSMRSPASGVSKFGAPISHVRIIEDLKSDKRGVR